MKTPTAPFEQMVLDVSVCGIDGKTNTPARLFLLMDVYTGIVFHNMYTTSSGEVTVVKFLRYVCNKYNFGSLNVSYQLITSLDSEYEAIIRSCLDDAKEIVFNASYANKIGATVRRNYVSYP